MIINVLGKGISITKIISIGIISIIVLCMGFAGCISEDSDKNNNSPKVEMVLERTFTIETDEPIDYTLHVPLPEDIIINDITFQKIDSIKSSPMYTIDESQSQRRMLWEGHLDSGSALDIVIQYQIKTYEIKWDIGYETSGTINDIPIVIHEGYDRNLYLRDAWPVKDYNDDPGVDSDGDGIPDERDVDDDNDGKVDKYRIEPSNPEIQNLLDDILSWADVSNSGPSSDLNVWQVTDAIYRYLRHSENKVVYPTEEEAYYDNVAYSGNPKWASGCFDDKRGDCDDQSILYISLCRAAGIPAWLEIGALYNYWTSEWEGHAWANIYVPLDDGKFDTPMVDLVNNLYLVRDPNRFTEWVDDCEPGQFGSGPEEYTWQPSSLERCFIAWQYTYTGSSPSIQTSEKFVSISWESK